MVRAHVFISGMVQGVNFRAFTKLQAEKWGLTGWVKNIPDGRVEALFEGEKDYVQKMVDWCHHGPPAASVENVEIEWEKATGEYKDFTIQR